jgi:hypothetical protein
MGDDGCKVCKEFEEGKGKGDKRRRKGDTVGVGGELGNQI